MKHALSTTVALGAIALGAPLALAGCTSKSDSTGAVSVTSSNDSCELSTTDATTGDVNFKITNSGSKVTEFYVYANETRVLGEVENIGPGLTGNLKVQIVDPGKYTVACKPGMVGQGIRKEINVTGDAKEKSQAPADVNAAKARYLDYVRGQTAALSAQTATFVSNVKNNNLDAARAQFGQVRTSYERIEPVAESFQDLDPKIDMRWDDTADGKDPFTGFHRIERYLWPPQANEIGDATGQIAPADAANAKTADTPAEIAKIADQLQTDVNSLKTEVDKPNFEFDTQLFVQGAKSLIDEVAATKVKGEEDRYSHTDLWDFAANVEGSQTLIGELQPIIEAKNKTLMNQINTAFTDVNNAIDKYRQGDGYVSYEKVTAEQRKELSDKIDALSAALSQVPGVVLG
ncbi:peptidase M75 family protein [Gordonia sp. TBRC 11910]|uniref:Peptidase M75 family protein n=1 Tax=Gordonia asplenii TaxID=2725283 RepID=A0A848L0L1_9ACTN|nr:iron uptake system protein EfeO [Gordonia asplenii]NMO03987.1 peptidase M75 family protein [Gordonia asplenii]